MKGIGIGKGVAVGHVAIYDNAIPEVRAFTVQDAVQEVKRFEEKLSVLQGHMREKLQVAEDKGQKEKRDIFEAHAMILEDPELTDQIKDMIKSDKINAEHAVKTVCDQFVAIFDAMDNDYLKQRANDIKDIRDEMIKGLMGISTQRSYKPGTVVVAKDFLPSDIHLTEDENVVGLLAEVGAETTHFAILAKISGIPTVLAVENLLNHLKEGDQVIVDGNQGEVVIKPSQEDVTSYLEVQKKLLAFKEKTAVYKDKASLTLDGHQVGVYANVANVKDLKMAQDSGAEGIGLFRTEFIYMDRSHAPSEQEQYDVYKTMLEGMGTKPVVIRTLDVGGDKELPYLGIPKEDNPFLGFRAIRYCLTHQPIFKTQLRALLRASVHGNLHIMIPMIATLEEVLATKDLLEEIKKDMTGQGQAFGDYKLGIMIEVPSAALIADILAKHVDFFSIGTNDLIQYTLSADRMNKAVSYLYSPYMPSMVRTLNAVITHANQGGIHVAMCGELASNPRYLPLLVGMGLHEFSMSPTSILETRYALSKLDLSECKALVKEVLTFDTESKIKNRLEDFYQTHLYEV